VRVHSEFDVFVGVIVERPQVESREQPYVVVRESLGELGLDEFVQTCIDVERAA
jgi:hypothetical protein